MHSIQESLVTNPLDAWIQGACDNLDALDDIGNGSRCNTPNSQISTMSGEGKFNINNRNGEDVLFPPPSSPTDIMKPCMLEVEDAKPSKNCCNVIWDLHHAQVPSIFYCCVCGTYQKKTRGWTIVECSHTVCVLCMGRVVVAHLKKAKTHHHSTPTLHLRCPYIDPKSGHVCMSEMSDRDVWRVLAATELWTIYKGMQGPVATGSVSLTTTICPYCSRLNLNSEISNSITCPQCKGDYCYYHANFHNPYEGCRTYETYIHNTIRNATDPTEEETKLCPLCLRRCHKRSQCNAIRCDGCTSTWCWLCNQEIKGDVEYHYKIGWCGGHIVGNSLTISRLQFAWMIAGGFFIGLIGYIFGFVFCCCVSDARRVMCGNPCEAIWAFYRLTSNIITIMILFLLWFVWAILWLLLSIIVVPIMLICSRDKLSQWIDMLHFKELYKYTCRIEDEQHEYYTLHCHRTHTDSFTLHTPPSSPSHPYSSR